ncbi:MAG TPA: phosphoribosylglycinamide formyltransferase [Candidatus Binatia bacterium]|nr:phosphoribosylglycinamide formyltransferase [Candidatus Binatia bacterium]
MSNPLSLGILASGSGTNLQAIIDAIENGQVPAEIRVVVCNRPGAKALERAERHGLPIEVVDHKAFPSREAFDERVVDVLRKKEVELVCLAGFDRLLSPVFVRAFPERILNIHPALLPAFPGLHAQRQALDYGVRIAGCTVHIVDEKTDHGPIVIQAAVPVYSDDTADSVTERILAEEHRIYAEAICLFAEDRIRVEGRRVRILEEEPLADRALVNPALG